MRFSAATTAAALATTATLGLAAPAFAATTPPTPVPAATPGDAKAPATLSGIQAKAASAVSARVASLQAAASKIQADTHLGADQAALLKTVQGDVPALQALGQKIAADTTTTTAAADYEDIFSQFRVYALVLPVAHLVGAADRIDGVSVAKLTAAGQKLTSHESSTDSAQVQPLVADLTAKVSAAQSATSGISATLLSLTPSQYDADHSVLANPATAVKGAVADVKAATADAKQAAGIEKAGHTHAATTPTTTAG